MLRCHPSRCILHVYTFSRWILHVYTFSRCILHVYTFSRCILHVYTFSRCILHVYTFLRCIFHVYTFSRFILSVKVYPPCLHIVQVTRYFKLYVFSSISVCHPFMFGSFVHCLCICIYPCLSSHIYEHRSLYPHHIIH